MIDNPDTAGPEQPIMISAWEAAGDHKGFVFVVREDMNHTWDKLLEQTFDDPSLLEMPCPTIGIEKLGEYSVGLTAQDTSLNQSAQAWISFTIVEADTDPLHAVPELCMKGQHQGVPIKTCQRATMQ